MNLPNYFLADLGREAPLNSQLIAEACQALKHNREQFLLTRSTQSLIGVLHEISRSWLDPEYSFRRMALDLGPAATGFPRATLAAGLDGFFGKLTGDNLRALLLQELGHTERLDSFVASAEERKIQRSALGRGPELMAHFCAGRIPDPTFLNIVLGLLVRAAQVVKCPTGLALLPRLFAHSIYEVEPKLGACLEIAEWPGGEARLEEALFREVDCVTATGSDETLSAIRQRLPGNVRFLGYGHRLSFGYITADALSSYSTAPVAARAAADVAAWNQVGCLSPHVFYVESGGRVNAEQFAEALAAELAKLEEVEPRGPLPPEFAAEIATRRAFYEVRAVHSPETRHWFSDQSTAWSVIYEADPLFQISCLNRFIYVKPVRNILEAIQAADAVRGQVSTVGLAATESRTPSLAEQLARWGVTRVCPLGQMQKPPLTWRHDGRLALGDLVTWTDLEYGL